MFIRRSLIALAAAALLLSFFALAQAAQEHTQRPATMKHASEATAATKEFTATGEIVDIGCYMSNPATGRGAAHKQCALMCIRNGMPIGLLTSDGSLYVLVPSHDDPSPYAKAKGFIADQVTVTGEKMTNGGVNAITVKSAEVASKS